MYTDRSHKSSQLSYSNNPKLKFIQEFVHTKIYNPDLIQKLKQKEIHAIRIKNLKSNNQNLKKQIIKHQINLSKVNKLYQEIKQCSLNKDQQSKLIQHDIQLIEQKINQLLNPSHIDQNQQKSNKIKHKIQLQQQIQFQNINLQNEQTRFKQSKQQFNSRLLSQNIKKQKLSQSIQSTLNILHINQQQQKQQKARLIKKKLLINDLKRKKQNLYFSINQKVQQKQSKLKNITIKHNQNTKAEQKSIQKMIKFLNQLTQIVQNPKLTTEQKKDPMNLVINVYYPGNSIHNMTRPTSLQLNLLTVNNQSPMKKKHKSFQTDTSIQNQYRSSNQRNSLQLNQNKLSNLERQQSQQKCKDQLKIPIIMLHSLQQLQIKYGLRQKQPLSPQKVPSSIRKQSVIEQNNQKSPQNKQVLYRNSLPTSLSEKDMRQQFIKYWNDQLTQLQDVEKTMNTKQSQMDKQISLLSNKINKKDEEINQIKEQNRKSFKKK